MKCKTVDEVYTNCFKIKIKIGLIYFFINSKAKLNLLKFLVKCEVDGTSQKEANNFFP